MKKMLKALRGLYEYICIYPNHLAATESVQLNLHGHATVRKHKQISEMWKNSDQQCGCHSR